MKNLIYQYWDGPVRESVHAGVRAMKAYADRIGAEYVFEDNPRYIHDRRFGNYSPHYGAFKPVFELPYRDYDNVLFADTDVFPVDGLEENIFEGFDADIGICTEPFQPKQRQITLGRITSQSDERWAQMVKRKWSAEVPRTEEGLVQVYNTGVVMYSNKGMQHAREKWVKFDEYVSLVRQTGLDSFYTCDQPYLHAMMYVTDMNVLEMDNGWNSYVHGTKDKYNPKRRIVDHRNESTRFVHCQFPGADNMNEEQLLRVVNLPRAEWNYDI
jgi:hypothetical protein